ncbi:hypothetical protein N6H14_26140 [Paenibacillus sp. CC-CFT747]|nr:hypothetical protein N6H14_26140 [Paenibacillus sp. CC-CFT747]
MVIVKSIPKKIQITVDKEEFHLPLNLQKSINNYWDSLIKEKPYLTRGEIFLIKRMSLSNEELKITLQKSDYAHFMFSQRLITENKYKCRSVVANGVIPTKDGYFVSCEMISNIFTLSQVHSNHGLKIRPERKRGL